jgi:hypothetical protein
MKNKKIFILSTLMITLLLASCTNKEVENEWESNENKQVLEEINEEVENMVQEIDTNTTMENTWTTDSKVQKLNKVYTSPGWQDEVEFSITMSWNTIENVDTKLVKWSEVSEARTKAFKDTVNTELKWKTLEEASKIKIIWGSSLTTEAFKSALKDIK